MLVAHAAWSGGRLRLWFEGPPAPGPDRDEPDTEPAGVEPHPFAIDPRQTGVDLGHVAVEPVTLRLPVSDGSPAPSAHLAHSLGLPTPAPTGLGRFTAPAAAVAPEGVLGVLDALNAATDAPRAGGRRLALADSARFFQTAGLFARALLAEQRFLPNLIETARGEALGAWRPWFGDEPTAGRVAALLRAMPASARAAEDALAHDAWAVLHEFLGAVADAECRRALVREEYIDAVEGRDPAADAHVAWLTGLLGPEARIDADAAGRTRLIRLVRGWLTRLDERGADSRWRVAFVLEEPEVHAEPAAERWRLRFEIRSIEHTETRIDAADVWAGPADAVTVGGLHMDAPHDLLLTELARAARVCPFVEQAIQRTAEPDGSSLTTAQAYEFLREHRPLLAQQGFTVDAPAWWGSPASRLALTLELSGDEPPDADPAAADAAGGDSSASSLGLDALVDYRWRVSIGGAELDPEAFESLADTRTPLVKISGRWVEIRPEDLKAARRFLSENPGGSASLGTALRLALGVDAEDAGLHVADVRASGWAAALFDTGAGVVRYTQADQPAQMVGALRPYQLAGLGWLSFLDRIGLGGCLADDMGLGKTVQLLALLQAERERRPDAAPTLVVAPLSVLFNWSREAARFTPALRVHVHHGPDRLLGEEFAHAAAGVDLVLTTYALAQRDVETLGRVRWRRVALDEAQNIKNPSAKQTRAINSLPAARRIALTGTPVENRLSELWSIMNFCNPGYLGTQGEFRRRFAAPIERRHSRARAQQLRSLTRPFILRRLKSDPAVAADLPAKIENKVWAHLTPEQAALYERAVERMLREVEDADGMRRRGVVLATLIRLKQICNHPAQALREPASMPRALDPGRSGKCQRLMEMLDEVLAEGQQALLFTQFRQMGSILAASLRQRFDRDALFLHGGTPEAERRRLIDRFQAGDGSAPFFVLSLKAGGFGLNLTAASHVFHVDRWWNPAVESQATDRAHRIGQTRTVHVHKFVVAGTLEERIDRMIEEKSDLAERIIGSGERGLTELSTESLRDLLTLRRDALEEDAEPALAAQETGHGL
ncbi:MAG: DEAD/DEAH box helicase [Planctomycetota bacterium]|nr:MAG: DEAD/DEAH box helicase [Planctomycetota bacterium]